MPANHGAAQTRQEIEAMSNQNKTIQVRAKAFSDRGVEKISVSIDSDGTVRVYDSIAGHYTVCHSLSRSAQARIRQLAREV
jgi:hypothetical protein